MRWSAPGVPARWDFGPGLRDLGHALFARLAVTIFTAAGAAIGALVPAKGAIEPRAFLVDQQR